MRYLSRLLLVIVTLGGAALHAQDASPAADPAAVEPPAPDPAAEAEAARRQQLAELAGAVDDEYRELGKGDEHADVFIQAARDNGDLGIVLLVPGDGLQPTTSPGLAQLRQSLPDHGWNTWLLSVERPPQVSSLYLDPPGQASIPAAPAAAPEGAEAATPAPADTGAQPAQEAQETLDQKTAEAWQQWREQAAATITLAASEARSDNAGRLVIAAENRAIPAVLMALREDPALADGVVLLSAIDVLGADDNWPENYPAMVLEVMTPLGLHDRGKQRRDAAVKATIRGYEQSGMEYPDWPLNAGTSPLARKIRGWLKRLDESSPPG